MGELMNEGMHEWMDELMGVYVMDLRIYGVQMDLWMFK